MARLPAVLLLLSLSIAVLADRAHAEKITIVALGDSLTQGYGLPADQGLVAQLQDWLDARKAGVRLVNAGVSGDTTRGGRARIDWTLGAGPVDGLIVALGGNDVLRGLPPEQARANLDAILQAAGRRNIPVLLVGVRAPANYGAEYQRRFDAIYPELAARHGALLMPDILAPLTRGRDPQQVMRELMQADGLHPNARGVGLIVAEMGPLVLQLAERARARQAEGGTHAKAGIGAASGD